MVASVHLGRHQQSARHVVRALALLRHMTPAHNQDPGPLHVNWGIVVTNAVGILLGLAITGGSAALGYMVWRLPMQQDQIIRNQESSKEVLIKLSDDLRRNELNDRVIERRVDRIETLKGIR